MSATGERAMPGEPAASQALGLGSERARRRGSGMGIDIGRSLLDAGGSVGVDAGDRRGFGLLPEKTF
ncbi:MAG: hypothetical protein V4540_18165 [Pseudomonadota bacterium]